MSDIPHMREATYMKQRVLSDPRELISVAAPLAFELGVDADYDTEPSLYIEQVRAIDPRYRNTKGEQRSISRQDVAERAHLMTDDLLAPAVMTTAEAMGITTPAYPFDEFSKTVNAVLVTGGVLSAMRERVDFAKTSGIRMIDLVGSDRPVQKAELEQLEQEGHNPTDFKSEYELSALVAAQLEVGMFAPNTINPDNLDVIREYVLGHKAIGRLAVVTTALYVPFTKTDSGVVAAALREPVTIDVYAAESDPTKVAARKVDVYRSEIARTLVGAVRWHAENKRRGRY